MGTLRRENLSDKSIRAFVVVWLQLRQYKGFMVKVKVKRQRNSEVEQIILDESRYFRSLWINAAIDMYNTRTSSIYTTA